MAQPIKVIEKQGAKNRKINEAVKNVMQMILDLREEKAAAIRAQLALDETLATA